MDNWKRFYKYKQGPCVANILYEPLISDDSKVFCMNWNSNTYFNNIDMTEEMYDFWFKREVEYLYKLNKKTYCPEVIDIDHSKRKIQYKWYDKNCNVMIEHNTINSVPDWKEKIKHIKEDLEVSGIFKINMYPHTFYFDDNNEAHIMDLYGCTDTNSRYLNTEYLKPLVTNDRFDKFIMNNEVDTHELYSETIRTNYAEWPGDFLNA